MVEHIVTLLTYLPLAAAGLAATTAPIKRAGVLEQLAAFEAHLADAGRG